MFFELLDKFKKDPDFIWFTDIYRSKDKQYSYKDLRIQILKYLDIFQKKKIKDNEIILIILKDNFHLISSFLAAAINGSLPAIYAYPSPKQNEKAFIMSLKSLLNKQSIELIVSYENVIKIISDGGDFNRDKLINFEQTMTHQAINENQIIKKDEAFIQFSSGTTGAKKGIKIQSTLLKNQIEAYNEHVKFNSNSKVISWLPHYHDMGLITSLLMPIFMKVPIFQISPFHWVADPKILFEKIDQYRCTHTWQPNFALGHMVKSISSRNNNSLDLSSLEYLACSSEPVIFSTIKSFTDHFKDFKFKKNIIQNCYGMAENTIYMCASTNRKLRTLSVDYKEFKDNKNIKIKDNGYTLVSSGAPLKNNIVNIFDDQNLIMPDGKIGNIYIKSNSLFDHYYNDPEKRKNIFFEDWFKTGDLGFKYENEIFVTGRKKELIIVGGENIYPQDIEEILNNNQFLIKGRSVAFGIRDERLETEKIIILSEIDSDNIDKIDLLDIRQNIFNSLNISISDLFLLPKQSLKKSTAGKISRLLNKELYENNYFDDKFISLHKNKLMNNKSINQIRQIINEISNFRNNQNIDDNTNLFENGLIDSFSFVNLVLSIEEKFKVEIDEKYRDFENFETINKINYLVNTIKNNLNFVAATKNANFNQMISKEDVKPKKFFLREFIINRLPFINSFFYKLLLRFAGMKIGKRVFIKGKINFKIRGHFENIVIEDDVIIGDRCDFRNRENGKIILSSKCVIDNNVRLVAARNGCIHLGHRSEIGANSIVNSGGIFKTGEYCLISANVNINSSAHNMSKSSLIIEQGHVHGNVIFGKDVLVGAGASIQINTSIGDGAVIGSNSTVLGDIPAYKIFAGVPAKFIRNRS